MHGLNLPCSLLNPTTSSPIWNRQLATAMCFKYSLYPRHRVTQPCSKRPSYHNPSTHWKGVFYGNSPCWSKRSPFKNELSSFIPAPNLWRRERGGGGEERRGKRRKEIEEKKRRKNSYMWLPWVSLPRHVFKGMSFFPNVLKMDAMYQLKIW